MIEQYDRRLTDLEADKRMKRISWEFVTIMLTLFMMAAGSIWWASGLDSRVFVLEEEKKLGKRNTLADGMVRDQKIKTLMRMAADNRAIHQEMEKKLDSIAEDVAVLRSRP